MEFKQLIIESTILGLYTLVLRNYFNINKIFVLGFLKHFLAEISGLHYYCSIKENAIYTFSFQKLFLESILEGILFYILYFKIFKYLSDNDNVNIFTMTFILHISFEF
jgi:hypothetical protein